MRINNRYDLCVLAAVMMGTLAVVRAEVREEFHQTYPLDKTGEVSLENVNGSVHVTAWDRDEVKVDAVKRAKKREHLEVVEIKVESSPDKIRIKTKYPDGKNNNNSTSVDYTLTVPRGSKLSKISTVNGGVEVGGVHGDVEASSVNGQVTARGLRGETGLSTVNGSVKATVTEVRNPILLKTVNGSVTLALPEGVNADVSADALNGGISSELDLKVRKSFPVGQKLEGKLGEGGPRIKLSTVNGSVHIDRTKAAAGEDK